MCRGCCSGVALAHPSPTTAVKTATTCRGAAHARPPAHPSRRTTTYRGHRPRTVPGAPRAAQSVDNTIMPDSSLATTSRDRVFARPPACPPLTTTTCRGCAPSVHSPLATTSRDRRVCAAYGAPATHDGDVPGLGSLGTLSAHDDDVPGLSTIRGLRRTFRRRVYWQHHHAGTRRHRSFDSVHSNAPRSTYTIGGAWARHHRIARPYSSPSHRSMEAP
ncbi:hypothetical protein VPH35_012282 [Triticum aestivum]